MSERSKELLSKLEAADWFHAAGQAGGSADVIWLGSWAEAASAITSYSASRQFVLPVNQIRYQLRQRCPDSFPKWGVIANAVRASIVELVTAKTVSVPLGVDHLNQLRDMLAWDLMHAAMEQEYAESCDIHYHWERVELLLTGHCPCSWEGEFPEGRHVGL
jgi:hypothetical protein